MSAAPTISLPISGGHLWLLPLGTATEADLLLRAGLNPDDLNRLDQLRGAHRRLEWLGARVLVRECLGGGIGYLPSGRPILVDSGLDQTYTHISISHTTGWAALMASFHGPCGVDIEPLTRDAGRVAGRIALPDEIAIAATYFPENPELLVWCAKESAYKAAGTMGMDFRTGIQLREAAARSLTVELTMCRIGIEHFTVDSLMIVCGIVL